LLAGRNQSRFKYNSLDKMVPNGGNQMIGLGVATSHAPMMTVPTDQWDAFRAWVMDGKPRPKEMELETIEVLNLYRARIENGWQTIKDQLADYDPEVIVMIGGDQTEHFDASLKADFMIHTGSEPVWAYPNPHTEPLTEEFLVRFESLPHIATQLLNRLVHMGFDVNHSSEMQILGKPDRGIPHAFSRPLSRTLPKPDIPVVLVYVNTYDPPCPTAHRCYEFGAAIARACRELPERIAIFGSGGLSHDPIGPRSGWIDEPLDRWVLENIATGNGSSLDAMYFPSMTMEGGTGEIRAWITVAGAMEELGVRHASIVDYLPAYKAGTGLAFAYWDRVAEG